MKPTKEDRELARDLFRWRNVYKETDLANEIAIRLAPERERARREREMLCELYQAGADEVSVAASVYCETRVAHRFREALSVAAAVVDSTQVKIATVPLDFIKKFGDKKEEV